MERTGIKRILVNIWPTIYRIVNNTFYFFINFFKNLINLMLNQIKNG